MPQESKRRKNPSRKRQRTEQDVEDGEELEVFARRAEWFRSIHGDRLGDVPFEGRARALKQMAALGRRRLREQDPGGPAPRRGFELIGTKGRLRKVDNPRPNSSFGFAGPAVQVTAAEALRGTILKIAIDSEMTRIINTATIRLFRYEESGSAWHMVPRSGVSLNGDYGWARLHREGMYIPIGLPCDYRLLQAVNVLHAYTPFLRAARQTISWERVREQICTQILSDELLDHPHSESDDQFELTSSKGELSSAKVRELCLRLDLPVSGLPEVALLKEPLSSSYVSQCSAIQLLCSQWTSIGPTNFSGRIKSLAIHPTNGNVVFAGAADGGVWKTTDGGTNWFATMVGELSLAIGALGIAPSNANVVYAATGEDTPGWGPSFPGIGVYKTIDGGNDWNLTAPIPSNRCTAVATHPTDPDIVYVSGNAGLHKSIDGGATWLNVRTDHVSDVVVDPNAPNTIYAGVWNSGIYKSTDGGVTWVLLSNGLPTGTAADWIKISMGRNGPNRTAYLVAKMGTKSGLLFKTINGGTSWTAIPGTHQPVTFNTWTNLVSVDASNQNVIFAGGAGFERSGNGGTSFTQITNTHSDHHALVYSPSNSSLCYMATDGGVYKSTNNGVSWALTGAGLTATQLYSIGVAQTTPFVVGSATQDQGIIKSTGTPSWADTNAGNEGGFFIVDPNNSNNLYVTPWSSNLQRSTNGGTNWTPILTGLDSSKSVNHLAVKPGDSNYLLCAQDSQLFRSTDQGNHWTSVLTTTGVPVRLAFSASNPLICFAVTDTGRVYKSSNSGITGSWSEPYAASPASARPPQARITAIGIGWLTPNVLYISYGGWGMSHVYRSVDGGVTWTTANGVLPTDALPDIPVSALAVDQFNPEIVYLATDIGVFRTRDGGDSWGRFSEGMPRVVTSEMALQKSTNTLYVSTMGRGAFKLAL